MTELNPPDWGPGVARSDGSRLVFTTEAGVRHFFESWDMFSGVSSSEEHVTLLLSEPRHGAIELELDHDQAVRWATTAASCGVPEYTDARFPKMFGKE